MKRFKDINCKFILLHLLILVACVLSITSVIFIIGGRITSNLFFFEYCSSLLILYFLFKNEMSKKTFIFNFIISSIIFCVLCHISLLFYDFSWDGNVYHKQMIGLMKNGMNPLYNVNSGDIWTQHYANGSEIWGAVLYSSFGDIEIGKCLNLILALCLCIYSYFTVLKISKSKVFSFLFSICLSFNPIIINQFHSYYIDGIVADSLFIFILSLINFILDNFSVSSKYNVSIFVASSIVLINSKFTALLFWGLFGLVLGGYFLFKNIRDNKLIEIRNFIIIGFSTGLFSVLIVGSSSYLKNTIQHHNPFYPLMGAGSVDIETGNEPELFQKYNHFEKWLYGTFSETYTWYDIDPKLKIPFSVSSSELYSIKFPDIRIGGLGVWYSGLLCLSIPIILIGFFYNLRNRKILNVVSLLLLFAILVPIPVLPVVWQARYYPEIYLIPFVAAIYCCNFKGKIFKCYGYLIMCVALINSFFMIPQAKEKLIDSRTINNQLVELAEKSLTEKVLISQDNYTFYGSYYNYLDKGIKYEYSKERLDDGIPFYYGAMYKIIEEGEK